MTRKHLHLLKNYLCSVLVCSSNIYCIELSRLLLNYYYHVHCDIRV